MLKTETKKIRYALTIEYLGNAFCGSQIQLGKKTIQSELERAIGILLKKEVKTVFAGRTDSGVHAKGQFLHFDTDNEIDKKRFIYSLNALLPDEISVKQMKEVDKSFHSQKSAKYRWYRYIIDNKPSRSVVLKNISTHIPENLDIEEMQKALDYIRGSHDFSSFKKTNSDNPAKECNIMYARCRKISGIIYIDLIANRFLYNMVRIIVGTLIKIGGGSYKKGDLHKEGDSPKKGGSDKEGDSPKAKWIQEVLNARNRMEAGPTANPNGLTLMSVGYNENYNLNELMNMEATNEQNILCKAS